MGRRPPPVRVHVAELTASTKTSFGYEDVIVGAVQFFGAED